MNFGLSMLPFPPLLCCLCFELNKLPLTVPIDCPKHFDIEKFEFVGRYVSTKLSDSFPPHLTVTFTLTASLILASLYGGTITIRCVEWK